MKFLHCLYVIVIISKVSKQCYSLSTKNVEQLKKEISREIQKLQEEINMLHQKTNINFEYCKLQPHDICGPCLCTDDGRVLKKLLRLSKFTA